MPAQRRRKAAGAILVSLIAHALLLTGLVMGMRIYRAPELPRSIEIEILPELPDQALRSLPLPNIANTAAAAGPRKAVTSPSHAAGPPVFIPPGLTDRSEDTSATNESVDAERLRGLLRGLAGCAAPDAYPLTMDERDACNRRAIQPGKAQFQIDPAKQAAFDADKGRGPFLARTPKNGCAVRVGAQEDPSLAATQGTTTGGISCAWQF
jgi:hypothetical protein